MSQRKIAVIAVHGVGDQKSGVLSGQIASQLQTENPSEYRFFERHQLTIAVDSSDLKIPPSVSSPPSTWIESIVNGAASRLRQKRKKTALDNDLLFTDALLEGGANYQSTYETTCLSSSFARDDVSTSVHIHELFWADLSHGGVTNGFAVLSQLMQLFLHMASLGRTALAAILGDTVGTTKVEGHINCVYKTSALSYWMLAVPILIGNVLFAIFGCLFLILLIPDNSLSALFGTNFASGVIVTAAIGWGVRKSFQRSVYAPRANKIGIFIACGVGLTVFIGLLLNLHTDNFDPRILLIIYAAGLLLVVASLIMQKYEASQPGALSCWYILLSLVATWGLGCALLLKFRIDPKPSLSLFQWFDYFTEGFFGAMVFVWGVLFFINCALLFWGIVANIRFPRLTSAVKQSIYTAFLAATIPSILFISVILFLWGGFASAISQVSFLGVNAHVHSLFFQQEMTVQYLLKRMIELSAGAAFLPGLCCILLAFLFTICGFAPSIIAELFPSKNSGSDIETKSLGNWLDAGFKITRFSGFIVLSAAFILIPLGVIYQYNLWPFDFKFLSVRGLWEKFLDIAVLMNGLGAAGIGGSAVLYLTASKLFANASLGSFSDFFGRLRVIVDTAIDVDNWLRERPIGMTPRLKIMARYVTLLRYIADQGYDQIVIVAHSQGSVITTELFRYLHSRNDDFHNRLKKPKLFTLGSPLRQLYASRFPGLYAWVDHSSSCLTFNFESWVNAYGSGDYVGRDLQIKEVTDLCVGAIAHTHYFGDYAPDVRRELNSMIR